MNIKAKLSRIAAVSVIPAMLVIVLLTANNAHSEALRACEASHSAEYCEYKLNREAM